MPRAKDKLTASKDSRKVEVRDTSTTPARAAAKRKGYADRSKVEVPAPAIDFNFVNRNYEMLKKVQETRTIINWAFIKSFVRNRFALISLIMLVVTIFLSIIMPFTTESPTYFYDGNHQPPLTDGHILGTDLAGRDLWARLWSGLRFSFGLSALATVLDILLGVILGLLMGYFAWFDKVMQFLIKILSVIPNLFLLSLIVIFFTPSFWVLVLAMLITGWMSMAQIIRGEVLRLKSREFTVAEKSLGAPAISILKSYIPILLPMIITQLVFTINSAFLFDASLALLGIVSPSMVSIGIVVNDARDAVAIYPLEIIFPILPLISVLVYVQFIGNGLEDVLTGVGRG